jgi:hypothetical protein
MIHMLRTNHRLQVILLVAFFLIGYGLYTTIDKSQFPPDYDDQRQFLSAARDRWSNNTLAHYRLDIQFYRNRSAEEFGSEFCEIDMEIVDEVVINTHTDTCNFDFPMTISALFNQIEQVTNSDCFDIGCPPKLPNVTARYNGDYGFPSTAFFWSVSNPKREYLLDVFVTPPSYQVRHFTVLEN